MRVRMLASFVGPTVDWPAGSEQEIGSAEAIRLIERGYAVPIADSVIETASAAPAPEKRKRK